MAKRKYFIKKSVLGLTAGITADGLGFGTNFYSSGPSGGGQTQKDWQTDPEWRRIKYGDWGGPGVSAQPYFAEEPAPKFNCVRNDVKTGMAGTDAPLSKNHEQKFNMQEYGASKLGVLE